MLNNRLHMGCFGANEEFVNAYKTNENRSVRTGQGELANRRHFSSSIDVVVVTDLVEKPAVGDAPSNWIVVGRYVCDPAIFDVLRKTKPGRGGEIQITDRELGHMEPA